MDAANHKHAVLLFHLAGYIRREFAMARINLARFQRTPEGAEHSTGSCGDHRIDVGTVRLLQFSGVDFVVLRNRAVYTENHVLR